MDIKNLKYVVRNAMADGYVNSLEANYIQKYALKDDNTVTNEEKTFLRDAYEMGAYMEPYAHYVFGKLITYGEEKITDKMDDLRKKKHDLHWFNDEYLQHAIPALVESTDNLTSRMNELYEVKRETNMFTSDYRVHGEKVLLNSHDSIAIRMQCLKNFKREANLFNSDYTELGKKLLLNSYDTKAARIKALDQFKVDAGLWNSEYNDLLEAIENDA